MGWLDRARKALSDLFDRDHFERAMDEEVWVPRPAASTMHAEIECADCLGGCGELSHMLWRRPWRRRNRFATR